MGYVQPNVDGASDVLTGISSGQTLSRIANWEHMTNIEKERTYRILLKRNQCVWNLFIEALELTIMGVCHEIHTTGYALKTKSRSSA